MNDVPLHQLLDEVQTPDELAQFVMRLRSDFLTHSAEWQNADVPACLDAIAAWIRDTEAARRTKGDSLVSLPPLKLFAQILYAAKVYE